MTIQGKVVLLGAAGAGKSALLNRLCSDRFYDEELPTIGAAYATVSLQKDPPHTIGMWDTAGQERYSALAPMYYRNSDIALIVYDITCRKSYERAWSWVDTLNSNQPGMVMLMIGAKLDLEDTRDIPVVEAAAAAERRGIAHIELSSKSGDNIDKLREWLLEQSKSLVIRQPCRLPSPQSRRPTMERCC